MERAPSRALLVRSKLHIDDRPDASFKQPIKAPVELVSDVDARIPEIIHRGPILRFARKESHLNTVNEPMATELFDLRLGLIRLVVPKVVGLESFLDGFNPDPN